MGTQSTWGQKKLKKMMKLLCLLLALTSLVITAPSCKTSAMCQACDASTADKCTACYNKGNDTTFNARALATNACANVITTAKITGCKVYNGTSDGTTIAYKVIVILLMLELIGQSVALCVLLEKQEQPPIYLQVLVHQIVK